MAKEKPKKKSSSLLDKTTQVDFKCYQAGSALPFQPGLSTACSFPPSIFLSVMLNLIKNPNITSSHLFRADIMYDSEKDSSFAPLHDPESWEQGKVEVCKLAKHMKETYRPRPLIVEGWRMTRLLVREMIPRNPNLDRPLTQTCCIYETGSPIQEESETEPHIEHDSSTTNHEDDSPAPNDEPIGRHLVIYVPHVESETTIPYYHPKVKALAFLYDWHPHFRPPHPDDSGAFQTGRLSVYPALFESSEGQRDRLNRVLTSLVTTTSRHGQGRLAGYTKRVNHDTIVLQARFQTTYTRLKLSYASRLARDWREVTDPTKHVFEDLGIAAFLIELWRDMYDIEPEADAAMKAEQADRGGMNGFVDIGCGNGVLVAILCWEGYKGWGFDVRRRKSWDAFEEDEKIKGKLVETVLIPKIFQDENSASEGTHDGVFPHGTFIISNHADELTPWTPVLARLSQDAPFLAIPCCSHDFSGARTRFPMQKKKEDKPPSTSAYQTLCDYVERLSSDVGYETQREYLRIPSTRNVGILGTSGKSTSSRGSHDGHTEDSPGATVRNIEEEAMKQLVVREMKGLSISSVAAAWRERTDKIRKIKGDSGH